MTWKHDYTYTLEDGHVLEPGSEFRLDGERGKSYRFIKAVTNEDTGACWIDCFGGSSHKQKSRSVAPEGIVPMKRKRKR